MTSSNTHDPTGAGLSDDLSGLEILLVEDSWVAGEAMKDLLELLGADVVGPTATTAEAERLLLEHARLIRTCCLSRPTVAMLTDGGVMVVLVVSGVDRRGAGRGRGQSWHKIS